MTAKKKIGRPKLTKEQRKARTPKSLRLAADVVAIIEGNSNQTGFVEDAVRAVHSRRKQCPYSLKDMRVAQGLSQEELAGETGLPQSAISSIERGGKASEYQAAKLAEFFLRIKLSKTSLFVGKIIQHLRLVRGYSQTELAKKAKVPQTFISNLETNSKPLTKKMARKMARVLKVTVKELSNPSGPAQQIFPALVGPRLVTLRNKAGLSISELAKKANSTAPHITALEDNEKELTERTALKLSSALGCSPIDFIVETKET